MANITSHRWEFYFRASTVLGIVGARSVDFELIAPLRLFDHYQRVHDSYHDLGLCRWTCPYQTGHLAWLDNLLAMNSRGERMRKPECGWMLLILEPGWQLL